MKIAFHIPIIDVRGTSVAAFDYAQYNEILLNNESIIISPLNMLCKCDKIALNRFQTRFELRFYNDTSEIDSILYDCNILYVIKYGKNDGVESKRIKTVVHCVFDMSEPHGSVYAGVSSTLAKKFGMALYVPHMIGLPLDGDKKNMRKKLEIPENARVFGRYGGMDTFDLSFARDVIAEVARQFSREIFFLFANTPKFCNEPNVIHMEKIVNESDKNLFINTCDAHLECGTLGHTFGLAIGEFSINNKPIIAFLGHVWNTAHYDILGDKAIYFTNDKEFYDILTTFSPNEWINRDNNAYRKYSPKSVMGMFDDVFLE